MVRTRFRPLRYFYRRTAIREAHVVNPQIDPTFSFMSVDHDGAIRMDCSSPYAMARLVSLKDRYRVAFANDAAADRHTSAIMSESTNTIHRPN